MKITILQGAFLPVPAIRGGAIEKAWNSLGQIFSKEGHEVTHVSRRCDGLKEEEWIGGVHHLRVSGFDSVQNKWLLKLKEWFYVYRARKVLPASDILVTHTFWAPLMLDPQQYGKIYVHVGRYPKGQFKFYSKASRFQVPTIAIKGAVKKEIPYRDKEISVLPYPLDWDVKSYANYETRPKRMLYLGRLHPEKGVLELVNAFHEVSLKLRGEWCLRVRGPWKIEQGGGGRKYLSDLQKVAKLSRGTIEILDPTFSQIELINELEASRFFVYPSLAEKGETFGLAVLEAMSCGSVPIVSSLPCFKDLVASQKTGYVLDPLASNIEKSLSRILFDAIQSVDVAKLYSSRCLERAKEFELDRVAQNYLEDFSSMLTEKES